MIQSRHELDRYKIEHDLIVREMPYFDLPIVLAWYSPGISANTCSCPARIDRDKAAFLPYSFTSLITFAAIPSRFGRRNAAAADP